MDLFKIYLLIDLNSIVWFM